MRMKKTVLLTMLLALMSTLTSFGKTDDDPVVETKYYELVVVPADTTMGEYYVVQVPEGNSLSIDNIVSLKLGYELDHWESKHGVNLDSVAMNDTIIAYFKEYSKVYITVFSSDTTKGTVSGNGVYMEGEKVYLLPDAKEGYKFAYWYSKSDTATKSRDITFFAERNDTIICDFVDTSVVLDKAKEKYRIVVLTEDQVLGSVTSIDELIEEGAPIPLHATARRGMEFDHWESVNGLPIDFASGNDTIYARFKVTTKPMYHIVTLSADTTKGLFYGEADFYEGEELPVAIYVDDTINVVPTLEYLPGYTIAYYVSKSTGDTIRNIFTDYIVTGNDTIVAYFDDYSIDPVITPDFNYADLDVLIFRVHRIDLYGNLISEFKENCRRGRNDSIVVTSKATGKTDTIPARYNNYKIAFGDTVSFTIMTSDEFYSDSVYTVAYTDSSTSNVRVYLFLDGPIKKVELEEAEGDSFNVNIKYISYYYNGPGSETSVWEGNGRYAKGDTITVEHDCMLVTNLEENVIYDLPEVMKFVVNNDIDLTFINNPNNYLIGVDQVKAEKESVADPYVNVYTINGYLIKQNVAKEDALNGLSKGIYIVGRKKVYVK